MRFQKKITLCLLFLLPVLSFFLVFMQSGSASLFGQTDDDYQEIEFWDEYKKIDGVWYEFTDGLELDVGVDPILSVGAPNTTTVSVHVRPWEFEEKTEMPSVYKALYDDPLPNMYFIIYYEVEIINENDVADTFTTTSNGSILSVLDVKNDFTFTKEIDLENTYEIYVTFSLYMVDEDGDKHFWESDYTMFDNQTFRTILADNPYELLDMIFGDTISFLIMGIELLIGFAVFVKTSKKVDTKSKVKGFMEDKFFFAKEKPTDDSNLNKELKLYFKYNLVLLIIVIVSVLVNIFDGVIDFMVDWVPGAQAVFLGIFLLPIFFSNLIVYVVFAFWISIKKKVIPFKTFMIVQIVLAIPLYFLAMYNVLVFILADFIAFVFYGFILYGSFGLISSLKETLNSSGREIKGSIKRLLVLFLFVYLMFLNFFPLFYASSQIYLLYTTQAVSNDYYFMLYFLESFISAIRWEFGLLWAFLFVYSINEVFLNILDNSESKNFQKNFMFTQLFIQFLIAFPIFMIFFQSTGLSTTIPGFFSISTVKPSLDEFKYVAPSDLVEAIYAAFSFNFELTGWFKPVALSWLSAEFMMPILLEIPLIAFLIAVPKIFHLIAFNDTEQHPWPNFKEKLSQKHSTSKFLLLFIGIRVILVVLPSILLDLSTLPIPSTFGLIALNIALILIFVMILLKKSKGVYNIMNSETYIPDKPVVKDKPEIQVEDKTAKTKKAKKREKGTYIPPDTFLQTLSSQPSSEEPKEKSPYEAPEVKSPYEAPEVKSPYEAPKEVPRSGVLDTQSESKTRFCSNCGTKIDSSDSFCIYCGTKL